ncbi:PepSY domain-containing protein [Sandarakinorhabdus cyanobacteriorum]|uniref:PepSY domain-containing protein n=1 Tax=Sandarakinorhabdus cyanobacteriorum TaxID=1981098 RepID=UPI001055C6C9|nr:PepSY domain-containing protein [Sandarakinorhabdus cyanobacteriorum]
MLSPRATRTVRWLHLWGGVIVGIQIILWVASGLVMVARPMDTVRGTDLRKTAPTSLAMPARLPALAGVEKLELGQLLGRPVWKLTDGQGKRLIDAATGQPIAITAREAEAVARAGTMMTGPAVVTPVTPAQPASDWRETTGFRVEFDDDTRVYINSQGEIGAVRTPWWRFYDLFWGLHIMDWSERENTHHPLIIIATLLSLGVVLTGALLTVRHFWRR